MKKSTAMTLAKLTGILILLPLLFACNNGKKQSGNALNDSTKEKPVTITCYTAIDLKDTAYLKVDLFDNGKTKGRLTINYNQKPKNKGTFEGAFVGDTLFVDYSFGTGTKSQNLYKNPLAFLKKDGNLILGPAIVRTYLGRSYLDKKDPINFEKGRFIFKPVPCTNQH